MNLDIRHIQAAALCCGDDATRLYLNGVRVEVGLGFVTYVGSDGRMLFASQHEADTVGFNGSAFILDSQDLKLLRGFDTLNVKAREIGQVLEGVAVKEARDKAPATQKEVTLRTIGHGYVDWRRVFPENCSGEVAQFDPEILASLQQAFIKLGFGALPVVRHNGHKPALVTVYQCSFAVGLAMCFANHDQEMPAEQLKTLLRPIDAKRKTRTRADADEEFADLAPPQAHEGVPA